MRLAVLRKPELLGHMPGYLLGPGERMSASEKASGRPTGALLPPPGARTAVGGFASLDPPPRSLVCLDLVCCQGWWSPLSDSSPASYRHAWGLLHGDRWRFVPVPVAVGGKWPVVYHIVGYDWLTTSAVKKTYGKEAAARVTENRKVLQLSLSLRRTRRGEDDHG